MTKERKSIRIDQLDIKLSQIEILEKKTKLKNKKLDSAVKRFSELENRNLKENLQNNCPGRQKKTMKWKLKNMKETKLAILNFFFFLGEG